jgi:hypothetical protein
MERRDRHVGGEREQRQDEPHCSGQYVDRDEAADHRHRDCDASGEGEAVGVNPHRAGDQC